MPVRLTQGPELVVGQAIRSGAASGSAAEREAVRLRGRRCPRGCGFQPQNHRLEAGATSNHRLLAGSYLVSHHASRWTVAGEKAGRHTAMYSAPCGVRTDDRRRFSNLEILSKLGR